MDRTSGPLPSRAGAAVGQDPLVAEATGEFPDLGEIGDEDIIADGGTQIMSREPQDAARDATPASKPPPVPKAPTSLDELSATVSAKHADSKLALPSTMAKVPPAPKTEPIVELDPDDLEEERRIERTQPFDRSRLFGAPRPGDGLAASARAAAATAAPAVLLAAVQPAQVSAPQPPQPATARPTLPSASWRQAPAPRLDLAVSPTLPPAAARSSAHFPVSLPSVVISEAAPPQNRPASIAPLAIDLAPGRALPDATLKLPPVRHVAAVPKTNAPVLAAAIAGGLALCAAAVIGIASFSSSGGLGTTPVTAARPREEERGAVRSAVIETPETTPQKVAPPPGTEDEDGTPVYSPGALPSAPPIRETSGASRPSSPVAQAASSARTSPAGAPRSQRTLSPAQPPAASEHAPPPVAVAPPPPAPRPATPPPTTGMIEVPKSLMTVMVDGDYKRVQGGRIVVTCGKHRVNAGRGTQMVDVPCGGVASAM